LPVSSLNYLRKYFLAPLMPPNDSRIEVKPVRYALDRVGGLR